MAGVATKSADEVTAAIRSAVDRALESDVRRRITERGQELASAVAEATASAAERASEAWRESEPTRREAARSVERASRDAARWSQRTWRKELRPALRQAWRTRGATVGAAAGAAVPAGQALVLEAAERVGLRRRERRHWGAFFIGLIVGAAAGALAALLLTPKPGRQIRENIASKGQEIATRGREAADTLAARARESEWVPLFQRPEDEAGAAGAMTAGAAAAESIEPDRSVIDGAAEAGPDAGTSPAAFGEQADRAGDETAGAINEAFESTAPGEAGEAAEGVETPMEAPGAPAESEERPA